MRTPSLFPWEHCYDAARAGVPPMVDVTSRKAADILAAAICGSGHWADNDCGFREEDLRRR
jgi:hypothetical protein